MGSWTWRMWTYYLITILPMFRIGRREWAGWETETMRVMFLLQMATFLCSLQQFSAENWYFRQRCVDILQRYNLSPLWPYLPWRFAVSDNHRQEIFLEILSLMISWSGEAKAKFSQEFYGEFSKLYIWNRVLTGQEVDKNYQCGQASSNGRLAKIYLTPSLLDSGGWLSDI